MQNYLVVTVIGSSDDELIQQVSTAIKDCGCHIVEGRMNSMGLETTMMLLLSGSWDTIAKMESQFEKLADRLDINISKKRTENKNLLSDHIPYAVDIVCYDDSTVVSQVTRFIIDNAIVIQDMHTSTYQATHTGAPMLSLHININIPASVSIASLRGDFMDFCEKLNLDAILEPVK